MEKEAGGTSIHGLAECQLLAADSGHCPKSAEWQQGPMKGQSPYQHELLFLADSGQSRRALGSDLNEIEPKQ